jgi:multisubunit Na+/H+ antiporter MnhB subunit
MIKTGLAFGSGVILSVLAFYVRNKKESFFESTYEVERSNSDDKFKILLESIN